MDQHEEGTLDHQISVLEQMVRNGRELAANALFNAREYASEARALRRRRALTTGKRQDGK